MNTERELKKKNREKRNEYRKSLQKQLKAHLYTVCSFQTIHHKFEEGQHSSAYEKKQQIQISGECCCSQQVLLDENHRGEIISILCQFAHAPRYISSGVSSAGQRVQPLLTSSTTAALLKTIPPPPTRNKSMIALNNSNKACSK